jgi:hypothetical protein
MLLSSEWIITAVTDASIVCAVHNESVVPHALFMQQCYELSNVDVCSPKHSAVNIPSWVARRFIIWGMDCLEAQMHVERIFCIMNLSAPLANTSVLTRNHLSRSQSNKAEQHGTPQSHKLFMIAAA